MATCLAVPALPTLGLESLDAVLELICHLPRFRDCIFYLLLRALVANVVQGACVQVGNAVHIVVVRAQEVLHVGHLSNPITKYKHRPERGYTRKEWVETHLGPESVHVDSTTRGGPIAAVGVAVIIARVHRGHLVAVGVVVLLRIRIGPPRLVTAPSTTSAVVIITSSRSFVRITNVKLSTGNSVG